MESLVAPNSNQSIFEALKLQNDLIVRPAPGHLMKAIKMKQNWKVLGK